MNGRSCAWFVVVGLVANWPALVRAYSDPGRYAELITVSEDGFHNGGGDNRWFTGSPAEGFSCAVCHSGHEGLELSVSSLPETYTPGQTYEIVVTWADLQAFVGANLEITDELGRPMGTIAAPPSNALLPGEICEGMGAGTVYPRPAAPAIGRPADPPLPGGRQVLTFLPCHATQVRWQWTAPPQPAGMAFLSGGVVVGDEDGTLAGDGVTVLARTILAPGQAPLDTRASGSCSVRPPTTRHSASGAWLVWVAALGLGMRRLSTRRARTA